MRADIQYLMSHWLSVVTEHVEPHESGLKSCHVHLALLVYFDHRALHGAESQPAIEQNNVYL